MKELSTTVKTLWQAAHSSLRLSGWAVGVLAALLLTLLGVLLQVIRFITKESLRVYRRHALDRTRAARTLWWALGGLLANLGISLLTAWAEPILGLILALGSVVYWLIGIEILDVYYATHEDIHSQLGPWH